jgi:hypothetical protein
MASSPDAEAAKWARTAGALLVGAAEPWGAATALQRRLLEPTKESKSALAEVGVPDELVEDFRQLLPTDPSELASACRLGAAFESGRRAQPALGRWRPVATWVGSVDGIRHRTAETLISLLIRARRRARLFAPFVDEPGLNALGPGMAAATTRGVLIDVAIREQTRALVHEVLPPFIATMGDPSMLHLHVLSNNEVFPHLKVLSVDGRWAYIGSANLTWAALIHNVELGVLVDGGEVVVLDNLFDQMLLAPADDEAGI